MQKCAPHEQVLFAPAANQAFISVISESRTISATEYGGEEPSAKDPPLEVKYPYVSTVQQIIPNARSVILYQPNRTCTRRGVSTLPAFRASSESTLLTTQWSDAQIKAVTGVSKTSKSALNAMLREA